MGKRRLKQSDEELKRGRRKKRLIGDYDDDDDEEGPSGRISGAGGGDGAAAEEEGEPVQEDAKPVGNPIRVSGKGKSRKTHYGAFEFNEKHFELEDSVLIAPENKRKKPYVAIIKDITQTKDGTVMVTGQWLYRPEEIEKKGGSWESHDSWVLLYSFHHDDVPAEAAMHKCVVHFVPLDKQLPVRSVHPGFIVQGVYDAVDRKIWKLTDKDYEEIKQHEIDMLIKKLKSAWENFRNMRLKMLLSTKIN
ncbi:hypothetical protein QJS10_CPB21g00457 [Acorus calamus]|uniref:BAH domain-containing protein n=1 Tax=Acorus calamus TaxID=4465 RepID=A0AAV9C2I2_ACOCL|nr:hypothetical protein QJS10_CPB21g00457 [Acorus calamus]